MFASFLLTKARPKGCHDARQLAVVYGILSFLVLNVFMAAAMIWVGTRGEWRAVWSAVATLWAACFGQWWQWRLPREAGCTLVTLTYHLPQHCQCHRQPLPDDSAMPTSCCSQPWQWRTIIHSIVNHHTRRRALHAKEAPPDGPSDLCTSERAPRQSTSCQCASIRDRCVPSVLARLSPYSA